MYRLSPDGRFGLCTLTNGDELHVFQTHRPGTERLVLKNFLPSGRTSSLAWLNDDRFAALVLDKRCPYAKIYNFFPTRVVTFDRSGHRLATGQCAFGIVAGRRHVALVGEQANSAVWNLWQFIFGCPDECNDGYDSFHHTWSVDGGKTWHDGFPLAFDGDDRVVYLDEVDNAVHSEDGDVLFKGDTFGVQWSV